MIDRLHFTDCVHWRNPERVRIAREVERRRQRVQIGINSGRYRN